MTARQNISLARVLVTLPITFHHALEAINANTLGIIFLIDNDSKLIGVLTDGEARPSVRRNTEY